MNKHYFYLGSDLSVIVAANDTVSVFQSRNLLLAELHLSAGNDRRLLATDIQKSVLQSASATAYAPYGYDNLLMRRSLLGFNGQARDPLTGFDLLGNGERAFSPVLMRFCSSDTLSPFGLGGVNAYAYCSGDPVNFSDPSGNGRIAVFKKRLQPVNAAHQPLRAVAGASHSISKRSRKIEINLTKLKGALSEQMVAVEGQINIDAVLRGSRVNENLKDFNVGVTAAVARQATYQRYSETYWPVRLGADEMALSLLPEVMRGKPVWNFLSHEWLARAAYSFNTHEELSTKIFLMSKYNDAVRKWEAKNIQLNSSL